MSDEFYKHSGVSPDLVLVAVCQYDDLEHGMVHERRERTVKQWAAELGPTVFGSLETLQDLCDAIWSEDYVWVGTVEQYEAMKADEERRRLEKVATKIAKAAKVGIDSLAFLRVVDEHITRAEQEQADWNDGETRAEQWAACMHSGAGQSTYFDDLNFENGRYSSYVNDLQAIKNWLAEQCPLLFAQYNEQQRKEES